MDKITESLKELLLSNDLTNSILAINLIERFEVKYKYQVLWMLKMKHPPLCNKCTLHNNNPDLQKIILEFVESNNLNELPKHLNKWFVCYFDERDIPWVNKYIGNTISFPRTPCCDNP